MKDRINKTSICSVVFIDIIDYSKKSVSEQIAEKEAFNTLLTEAIKDVAQNDRIIIDTGDGAAIALMGAPEEALFVSLTIRDGIIRKNKEAGSKLLVRIGINLGPVRVVIDINGMPNIIGDGINVAQRVMTFAEPNQILVSRSYYEITSRLTQEITDMFAYSGIKQDKHVREHEVYVIKPSKEELPPAEAPVSDVATLDPPPAEATNRQRYIFAAAITLLIGVVIAGVLLPGLLIAPEKAGEHAAEAAAIDPVEPTPAKSVEVPKSVNAPTAKAESPAPAKKPEKAVTASTKPAAEQKVAKKAKPKTTETTQKTVEQPPEQQATAPAPG